MPVKGVARAITLHPAPDSVRSATVKAPSVAVVVCSTPVTVRGAKSDASGSVTVRVPPVNAC